MKFILDYKNGEYSLTKIDSEESVTVNQEKIESFVKSVKISPISAYFYKNEVKLFFGDDKYIILKNYKKNKDCKLYCDIESLINDNTRVNVVNNINISKIKGIVFTGVALATMTFAGMAFTSNDKKVEKPISFEQTSEEEISIITSIPESVPIITPKPSPTPLPTTTPEPVITPAKQFENRYTESMLLKYTNSNFVGIPLATKFDDYYCNTILKYSNSEIWNYMYKYGNEFGVDPYLVLAICYTESNLLHYKTIPGGSSYNGYGVGIAQHESPDGTNKVTAFNFITGEYETEIISMENACNLEKNIKIATMILSGKFKQYNNNIYAVIQSYNYGDGAMKIILGKYAKETNRTIDEVLSDFSDTGWLKYVSDFHINANKYINWPYEKYGNPNYISDVLGYYLGTCVLITLPDGNNIVIDLVTLDKTYETKTR